MSFLHKLYQRCYSFSGMKVITKSPCTSSNSNSNRITIGTTNPTNCTQTIRSMASYINHFNPKKKSKLHGITTNNLHEVTSSSSSLSSSVLLLDQVRVCASKLVQMLDWHISCTKRQKTIPNIISMCIHTDHIDIVKISYNLEVPATTNTTDVTEEEEHQNNVTLPWWRKVVQSPNRTKKVLTAAAATASSFRMSDGNNRTLIQSIPIKYSYCTKTKLRSIQNTTYIIQQLQQQFYTSNRIEDNDCVVDYNKGNHQHHSKHDVCQNGNSTSNNSNSNAGILCIYWPINVTNRRNGYDSGRVLYVLDQLLASWSKTTSTTTHSSSSTSSSISSNSSNSSSGNSHHQQKHSQQIPIICLYDPTRTKTTTICEGDEDEWGRCSSYASSFNNNLHVHDHHAYNNHTNSKKAKPTKIYINPPYRYKDQSILLNRKRNTSNDNNNTIIHNHDCHHHHNNHTTIYNPISLWNKFCHHHWPTTSTTTAPVITGSYELDKNNNNPVVSDMDDDNTVIPIISSKPIIAAVSSHSSSSMKQPRAIRQPRSRPTVLDICEDMSLLPSTTTELIDNCTTTTNITTKHSQDEERLVATTTTTNNRTNTTSINDRINVNPHNHNNILRKRCVTTPLAAKRFVDFDAVLPSSSSTTTAWHCKQQQQQHDRHQRREGISSSP